MLKNNFVLASVLSVFVVLPADAAGLSDKIGFKGIYLGMKGSEACKTLKVKYPDQEIKHFKKHQAKMFGAYMNAGCENKKFTVYLDDSGIVIKLYATYDAFGIESMSLEKFGQLIVKNYDWLPTLDVKKDIFDEYNYAYEEKTKIGFSVDITRSYISVKSVELISNKPSFD